MVAVAEVATAATAVVVVVSVVVSVVVVGWEMAETAGQKKAARGAPAQATAAARGDEGARGSGAGAVLERADQPVSTPDPIASH